MSETGQLKINDDWSGVVTWSDGWGDAFSHVCADVKAEYQIPGTYVVEAGELERLTVDGRGRLNRD